MFTLPWSPPTFRRFFVIFEMVSKFPLLAKKLSNALGGVCTPGTLGMAWIPWALLCEKMELTIFPAGGSALNCVPSTTPEAALNPAKGMAGSIPEEFHVFDVASVFDFLSPLIKGGGYSKSNICAITFRLRISPSLTCNTVSSVLSWSSLRQIIWLTILPCCSVHRDTIWNLDVVNGLTMADNRSWLRKGALYASTVWDSRRCWLSDT